MDIRYALHAVRAWLTHWLKIRRDPPPPLVPVAPANECAIHGYEPIPLNAFRVCGECWHAYPTAQNLVDEHNKVLQDLANAPEEWSAPPTTLTARKITVTPLDADGVPIGEPVRVPDANVVVTPSTEPAWSALLAGADYKIHYVPLTVQQVDLITCCPMCTHDW